MKKMLLTIGSLVLMMGLAFSASAQGGRRPKADDGKRPSEIVRQPKGSESGKGGSKPERPPKDDRGGNDRGGSNRGGDKPKKPNFD